MEETRILLRSLIPNGKQDQNVSAKALQLYKQLMIEANTQLGLFVLPEETFSKYETLMRVTLYEQMKKDLFAGEDPRAAIRRSEIQAETQMQTSVYT